MQQLNYGDNWRLLSENEKAKIRAHMVSTHKVGNIFFKIPQFWCYFMTIVVIVDIISEWKTTYADNIMQVVAMLFFALPAMYGFFWLLPRLIAKAYNREITAIDRDLAVVCTRMVTDKRVFMEGGGQSRRHVSKLQVFKGIVDDRNSYVKTSMVAYNKLQIGDLCSVVFFPKDESEAKQPVFMCAFCEHFEDI